VRPDFAVTDDNAAAVAEICRHWTAALAIELAAARWLFSPGALRVSWAALELLRKSARDVRSATQTLRATIEWATRCSSPPTRVFERLAVVLYADAGLATLLFANRRTGRPIQQDIGGFDVIESLASLIEKSLVRQVDVAHGEPRMQMLETIREYATEQLDRRPEAPAVRRAHAGYYADMAARLKDGLSGADRDQAIATMAIEVGNLRITWK
jgi:predicted ATPase